MIRIFKKSHIAFVGGGKVCKSMLKILLSKHFAIHRPFILGVADINDKALGIRYAKNKGIFTTRDYRELYSFDTLNLIIELTGNDRLLAKLKETKPSQVRLIDHFEAMSLWDFIQIEEKKLALKEQLRNELTKPESLEREFDTFSRQLSRIVEERTRHLQTAEKELVERERAFSQIIQATAIPTFVINRDRIVTHWNNALESLTNIQAYEMVGTNKQWMSFYSEKRPTLADCIIDESADRKAMRKYYGESLRKSALVEGAYETETFWPELGESGKWFYTTAAPIRSPDGEVIGAIENILDITARKLLQQEREKQVRQLKALWAISSALSASLDLEESLQTAVGGIIAYLDVDSAGIYLKDQKTADFRVAYSSGYSEPFFQPGSKVGPDGIIGTVAQIDEPRFFEDVTLSTTPYKEFVLNEKLKSAAYFPLASQNNVFGVLRVSSHTSSRFVLEDKEVLALISNFIALAIESAMLRHQEEMFSLSLAEKVTEKTKELEKYYLKLRQSEERYRLMFDADPNPIFILDKNTAAILEVNKTAADCYAYSKQELLQMSFLDLQHKRDEALLTELKQLSPQQSSFYAKRIHKRKCGEPFYVNIHIRAVSFMDKDYFIVRTPDVTDRVETETKLVQAGKMATLGTMASGIAHEINQPLNVIQVCADYFQKMIKKGQKITDEDLYTMSEEIGKNVQRAAQIIKHMREFARQSEVARNRVDINNPIRDVFTLLGQQLVVHQVAVELDLSIDLPLILADHNRLEQVFVNLVTNAMDALDEKGKQTDDPSWKKMLKIKTCSEDGQVIVIVSDNGTGMPEEVKEKIFEPFFTTKEVGKGTGLGTSISYGIVKDYEGTIDVQSSVGKGTSFELRFPAAFKTELA